MTIYRLVRTRPSVFYPHSPPSAKLSLEADIQGAHLEITIIHLQRAHNMVSKESKRRITDKGTEDGSGAENGLRIIGVKGERTYPILQHRYELHITRRLFCTILNESAKCPQAQWWLPIFLDDVDMRVIRPTAHLARLGDDGIDPLRERIFEEW